MFKRFPRVALNCERSAADLLNVSEERSDAFPQLVLEIREGRLALLRAAARVRGRDRDHRDLGDQRSRCSHFSDTWQLVINTATTIVTFLMVFLIQNTQNRDTEAIQVKLDELIRATKGAHNALLDLEELEDDEVDEFRKKYQLLADAARRGKRGDMDLTDE